ncbi:MAG: hypothetical protein JWO32_3085 [Bacteroidetes bacterium]|nr:hypothetical protein [Bacteroidota bacterium]
MFCCLSGMVCAQKPVIKKNKSDVSTVPNFYDAQKKLQAFYENKEDQMINEEEEGEDVEYNQYKRWEWFNEQRVYPTGKFPSPELLWNEYYKYKVTHSDPAARASNAGNWTQLGSSTVAVGSSAGAGRVNCFAFLPGNPTTMFAGAACGGVWKSTNGGVSWSVLNTDLLPSMSISDISIDPLNPNRIYIATGDNFGITSNAGLYPSIGVTLAGHFGAGVLTSTNAGITWTTTGLSYTQNQFNIAQRLVIHPTSTNILLLTTNTGIFRSTNNGTTWTNVKAGAFYTIEFNPSNPNVVFATDAQGLWRSNNSGATWSYKGGGYPNAAYGRVSFNVTPADTSVLYLWGPTGGFKKYSTLTNTFTTMTNPDPTVNPLINGYYDRAMVISPVNANEIYVGATKIAHSTDAGATWSLACNTTTVFTNPDYIHTDQKRMAFLPGSSTKLYTSNDGGIYTTSNAGASWTNLSNSLQIAQVYRLASTKSNNDTIYFGAQDGGSNRLTISTGNITQVFGGDGMQPLVNYNNSQNVFVCQQSGNLKKSTDGGNTFAQASPGVSMWVTPYVMNQLNPNTMYIGTRAGVQKSNSMGTFMTFTNTTSGIIDSIIALAVTKADTNVVYAAKLGKIAKTTNGGITWTNITGTLPVTTAGAITYIAISSTNPNLVFVTLSGYSAGNKVFMSSNGGTTWTNYSGTLPNVPVNCIVYQTGSNDALYIGTDFGVFTRDAAASDWTPFGTGLPNVIIDHLEIHYGANKLRAATYGRGIWQADLPIITGLLNVTNSNASLISVFPNPTKDKITVTVHTPAKEFSVSVCNLLGQELIRQNAKGTKIDIDLGALPGAEYLIKVTCDKKTEIKKIIKD